MTVHEILTDYWKYRELLRELTLRDIRIRYKQAVMGLGWAFLTPALVVLAGVMVRYAIQYLSGSGFDRTAMAGITLKAVPWSFFVGAIGFSSGSLVGNRSLVTKVYFPREVLPISATLSQAFDALLASLAVLVALVLLGVDVGYSLLWVLPLALLLIALTAAIALFLSAANLFFRDVKYIVQVLLTFGIFVTPVLFEPAMFGELGSGLIMLNPLSPMIEGMRLAVVEGHNLLQPLQMHSGSANEFVVWSPWYLGYGFVWATVGVAAASLMFHRLEFLFAEYV